MSTSINNSLSTAALNQLFIEAKTHSFWQDKAIEPELLQSIYDLAKLGSTSANCQPMRVVFVSSREAKEKLRPCMFEANVDKTMSAPVTALFAYDMKFYENLPKTFPHFDARPWFTQSEEDTFVHAFRNANLQAAYFMLAARAKGVDCGPMSGFDAEKANAAFFEGTSYKINFMCNLGYGDLAKAYDRLPRLDFSEVCTIV